MIENLRAASGVAYEKSGAIFPSLVAPTPAPTLAADEKTTPRKERKELTKSANNPPACDQADGRQAWIWVRVEFRQGRPPNRRRALVLLIGGQITIPVSIQHWR